MLNPDSIFISYRRSDSQDITGRIYDYLEKRFGSNVVFRDVYSIPLGDDYRIHLREKAQNCQVLVAVIGPDWVTITDPDGNRRLDNPNDWVRLEVETALERGIPVIPLLIGGATIPEEKDLPSDLKPLAHRNAALARPDPDFQSDMERLIRQLEKIVTLAGKARSLTRGQQLKLDYLQTKLTDLEMQLRSVQKELGAITDVTIAGKLEKRQILLLEEIDEVDQTIQTLKIGDG
ncbi:MAG: TIR domain-containing protein [Leptolyngbyaceae cyanobacterium MO_188.B28]|nr:TIR domain-containing protein [Leptolyngbyaceae cyanobacterium MO_188.B28]